jgi:hypothetical protein
MYTSDVKSEIINHFMDLYDKKLIDILHYLKINGHIIIITLTTITVKHILSMVGC